MREIEAKWPEWERPYLLHGVMLERRLPAEARQKFQMALALGLSGEMRRCAMARADPLSAFDSKCACFLGLLDWFEGSCSGQPVGPGADASIFRVPDVRRSYHQLGRAGVEIKWT